MTNTQRRRIKRYRNRFATLYTLGLVAFLALLFTLMVVIGNQNAGAIRDRDILDKLNSIDQSIDTMQENRPTAQTEPLGTFTVAHYCSCEICTSDGDGICKNGEKAIPDYTIATDPNVIPTGSIVLIDGKEYKAMDTGGAIKGNKVDIFCESHEIAIQRGKIQREVFAK